MNHKQNKGMTKSVTWQNFQQHYLDLPELGMALDTSRMNVPDKLPNSLEKLFNNAFQQMQELEAGSIANPDENRMVGHYWLRNPALAPNAEIQREISSALEKFRNLQPKFMNTNYSPKRLLLSGMCCCSESEVPLLVRSLYKVRLVLGRIECGFIISTIPTLTELIRSWPQSAKD